MTLPTHLPENILNQEKQTMPETPALTDIASMATLRKEFIRNYCILSTQRPHCSKKPGNMITL